MWGNRNVHALLVGMQIGTATLKDSLAMSYKTKHTLTVCSSNHTPWYSPKELKICVCTKTCTQMFIAALFIIAKNLKQPRCPSVGEWINELWYVHLDNEILFNTKKN